MKRTALLAFGLVGIICLVLLVLAAASSQPGRFSFLSKLKLRYMYVRSQYEVRKVEAQQAAIEKALESGRAVSIAIPYHHEQDGPWMNVEEAIRSFARSNRIALLRFESAGSADAHVCVWRKDAAATSRFVSSLGGGANNAGPANRSLPFVH